MVGKDLIMATLFGSGGGSSGSGGGSAGVSPKEVNFYDYDGTCVHAYTVAEAQALSELPAGPEHPGLVFQGWNWSLEGVKGLTRAMNIGAMYTTDDGTTRLYITLQEGRTSPMLGVGVKGTVTVDWGDGTEPDVLTGTSTSTTKWTPNHAYAAPGDYVIRLTVDGEMAFLANDALNQNACVLRHSSGADVRNYVYQIALKKMEIGECVTSIKGDAFAKCFSLTFVTIPNSVTSIAYDAFVDCYDLTFVTFPNSLTSVISALCQNCYSLAGVTIPNGVTTIYDNAFSNCYNLTRITIPNSVTVIKNRAFYYCQGMRVYDFTSHTAVPTIENTYVFSNIPADCEIRVPAALYDEWIAATNWATYADKIKAY